MKRFFSILFALLSCAACEIPFDLRQEGTPKIYLQAIAGDRGIVVTARFAAAVGQDGGTPQLRNGQLQILLNGTPLTARTDPDDPFRFSADFPAPLQEGDRISVRIEADGVESASGSTVGLRRPDILRFESEAIEAGEIRATAVRITLDEAPGPDDYFGIQILKSTTFFYPDAPPLNHESYLTPGYILTAAESGKFDLEDFMQVNYSNAVLGGSGDYRPLTLLSQKQFDGAEYRFYLDSFDSDILEGIGDQMPEGDTGIAGGGIVSGEVGKPGAAGEAGEGFPESSRTVYSIYLYRLSPETYFYAKALYQSNFDFLANMGLTPANFTWSNVRGGLGFVGTLQGENCIGRIESETDRLFR